MRDWYSANVMNEYGIPLNSRKTYTKDDWCVSTRCAGQGATHALTPSPLSSPRRMTFLAATYYTTATPPAPSDFSAQLHTRLFNWANETTDRDPFSDWIETTSPTAAGFEARPVMGALWAPMLVAQGPQLGLGHGADAANAAFRAEHARIAAAKAATAQ